MANATMCGHCCGAVTLCEKCLVPTLLCNGLKPSLVDEIRDVKVRSQGHGGHYRWAFSDLNMKLDELLKDENNWRKRET